MGVNDRPIYTTDGGSKWMAVKTVSGNIIPSWIVSLSQFGSPGSSSGLMFGGSRAPKCPTAVSTWSFFSQTSGNIEDDATLKVVCDGGCSADPQQHLQTQPRTGTGVARGWAPLS